MVTAAEAKSGWREMADRAVEQFPAFCAAKRLQFERYGSSDVITLATCLAAENAVLVEIMKAMSARITALEEAATRPEQTQ